MTKARFLELENLKLKARLSGYEVELEDLRNALYQRDLDISKAVGRVFKYVPKVELITFMGESNVKLLERLLKPLEEKNEKA